MSAADQKASAPIAPGNSSPTSPGAVEADLPDEPLADLIPKSKVEQIVRDRLERYRRKLVGTDEARHAAELASVAQRAATAAASAAREAADSEWSAMLSDAGVDLDGLRRAARVGRAMTRASRNGSRTLRKGVL